MDRIAASAAAETASGVANAAAADGGATHAGGHGGTRVRRGLSLRAYLAAKLNCDPMRITKKFTSTACLGKSVYRRSSEQEELPPAVVKVRSLSSRMR